MKRLFLFAVVMALPLARPDLAAAEIEKGTLRLHLESTFFGFSKGELDPEGPVLWDFQSIHFGIGTPEREFSLARQSVGFGFALIPNLVLGGRVTMALLARNDDIRDSTFFVMGLVPYVEYVFLDGTWRPFVTGMIGVEGWFGETRNADYRLVNFVGGAGGGLHVFLAPQFSIDATALFSFAVGGGTEEYERRRERDLRFWAIEIGLLLGLSGWI